MNHEETLAYLDHLAASGMKLELDSVRRFLAGLGSPQDRVSVIHVAGSNGKGSVSAFLASILGANGYRVGLYTSPHLVHVEERIALDGQPIAPEAFAAAATRVRNRVQAMIEVGELQREPTYFEFLTGMAFHVFAAEGCEIAVVEAGMGGRLDATNTVAKPVVSLITRIDLEHTGHLGATLEAIAREKAGIARPGVPVLTMEAAPRVLEALRAAVQEAGSSLVDVRSELRIEIAGNGDVTLRLGRNAFTELAVPLPGQHQLENLALALRAVLLLGKRGFHFEPDRVRMGVAETRWPGRLEVVRTNPTLLLDGAHNPAGAAALAAYLEAEGHRGDLFVVFGAMQDKDIPGTMRPILPRARKVFLTRAPLDRAASLRDLEEAARDLHGDLTGIEDPGEAVDRALEHAGPGDTVLVTGSLILQGAVKRHLAGD